VVSWQRLVFPGVAVVMSVFVFAAIVELGLRLAGRAVPKNLPVFAHAPVMTRLDRDLGWVPVPGRYAYSTTGAPRHRIEITVDTDRTREVAKPPPGAEEIWFFGCSFTYGWGVTDGDDYVGRIAAKLPRYRL
jgi:hypothetical protein